MSTPADSQVPPGGWDRPIADLPPVSAPPAGWWRRAGAALIDLVVISIPAGLVGAGVFGVTPGEADDYRLLAFVLAALAFLLLLAVAAILYAPLLMRRPGERNGQTWGKQAFGIRVVRTNGVPMDFTWSALREALVKGLGLGFLSTIIPLVPYVLDALWPLWDERNRALHDMVVGTLVVEA